MNIKVEPNKEFNKENLQIKVYNNRKQMGFAAGKAVASRIKDLLMKQQFVTMVFAAAPSQNEFLKTLTDEQGIDWRKVIALHMDEYVGLPKNSPQSFRKYLETHIINVVNPGQAHFLNGNARSISEEIKQYSKLLLDNPIDIVCCGIGENGHLAFNDPSVADFLDPEIVKVVELEKACRQQQVNDDCFSSLDQVPMHALTLSMPTLLSTRYMYCVVPGSTKAAAVRASIFDPVSTSCPASVLRRHFRSVLYLDTDSADLL